MSQTPAVLADLLRARAASHPDKPALVDGDVTLTFAALLERATRRAAGLSRSGIKPGDRVGIVMQWGTPLCEVWWGAQLAGAVPCVFNPNTPAETVERRIGRLGAALVVTEESVPDAAGAPPAVDPDPDALAFLQPTSGTSGEPRFAMLPQRTVLAQLATVQEGLPLTSDDVFIGWVPPWHDLGLVRFLIGSVYLGATCHLIEPAIRTIPQLFRTIGEVGGTHSGAPDFVYRMAMRMVDPATVDLSSVRFLANGGEPVRASTIESFEQMFSCPGKMLPAYGMAEAVVGISSVGIGERANVDARGNVSCGRVFKAFDVRAGTSPDDTEEILLRGPSVFAGYLDAPEETARVLRDGWLHTGDSGYLDENGEIYVLGRRSGMIKRAGAAVAPRELEEAAQRVPGTLVVAAVAVPGASGDDAVLVVEAKDRPVDEIVAEVSRSVAGPLGFAPGRVAVVPPRTIPRTENGKIRHDELRQAVLDGSI